MSPELFHKLIDRRADCLLAVFRLCRRLGRLRCRGSWAGIGRQATETIASPTKATFTAFTRMLDFLPGTASASNGVLLAVPYFCRKPLGHASPLRRRTIHSKDNTPISRSQNSGVSQSGKRLTRTCVEVSRS